VAADGRSRRAARGRDVRRDLFPIVMGLNPQLAIMMSGIATTCFLLIVQNKVPSYLGTSASFVGGVVAIPAQGGDKEP